MSKNTFVFRTLALLTLFCAGTVFAQAQLDRTYVSRTGSDANPCSKTSPCATFAGAYAKTNIGGEINAVEPGDYSNGSTFVIQKSITIDGLGVGATLTAQNFQDAIRVDVALTDTVIIRNLSITGFQESTITNPGDSGIRFHAGGALVLQNLDVHSFEGAGIIAQVRSNSAGAAVRPAQLAMSDVKTYNNYGYGVYLDGRDGQPLDFAIDNLRSEANGVPFGNGVGVAILAIGGDVRGVIRDSVLSVNQTGINVGSNAGRSSRVHIEDSSISTNSLGLQVGFSPGGDNIAYLSDSVIQFNQALGITISGGQVISFGDNKIGPGQGSPTSTLPKQ